MKHPNPTRESHEAFCRKEGWTKRGSATKKGKTDHVRYELVLDSGEILYTRISRPVNRDGYGADQWHHILRDQLKVTEDEYWDCVQNDQLPARSIKVVTPEAEALPASLVAQLIKVLRLTSKEIQNLTREEAFARLNARYSDPKG